MKSWNLRWYYAKKKKKGKEEALLIQTNHFTAFCSIHVLLLSSISSLVQFLICTWNVQYENLLEDCFVRTSAFVCEVTSCGHRRSNTSNTISIIQPANLVIIVSAQLAFINNTFIKHLHHINNKNPSSITAHLTEDRLLFATILIYLKTTQTFHPF